jgi:DNA-binding transcriptional LysR family regulator
VVRDSGNKRDQRAVSIEVNQRWTVSQVATSIQAVCQGHGFAWLPEKQISQELAAGILKPLALREGAVREVPLYLILANPDSAGPGVKRLADIFKASVS